MGCLDRQPVGLSRLARKLREYLVEHAKPAPPHEPVVDRLVWTVVARRMGPAQTISDGVCVTFRAIGSWEGQQARAQ